MPALVLTKSQLAQQQLELLRQQQQTTIVYPDVNDCLAYLDEVKKKFKDDRKKFHDFLGVLKKYKTKKLEVSFVVKQISQIFQGHPELIEMFNGFLDPREYKLKIEYNKLGYDVYFSITECLKLAPFQKKQLSRTIHIMSHNPITTQPVTLSTTSPVKTELAGLKPNAGSNTNSVVMNLHHTSHNNVTPSTPPSSIGSTQIPLGVKVSTHIASTVPQISILTSEESTDSQNQQFELNHVINNLNNVEIHSREQPEQVKSLMAIKNDSVVTIVPLTSVVTSTINEQPVYISTYKKHDKETTVQNVTFKRASSSSSNQILPAQKKPKSEFSSLGGE